VNDVAAYSSMVSYLAESGQSVKYIFYSIFLHRYIFYGQMPGRAAGSDRRALMGGNPLRIFALPSPVLMRYAKK
jgi:hypothetical protein